MRKLRSQARETGTVFIWPGMRWVVSMHIDQRKNITEIFATAIRGQGDSEQLGHAQMKVGPFDDINTALDQLMLDAALNVSDQLALNFNDGSAPGPD